MIRVRPTVVKSTILILHVLGPGVQLALTVSNNDSVAFLKSLAAANLWQRMSHPGLASPDDLAKKMRIGRLDYFWDDANELRMYGVGEGAYELRFTAFVRARR